MTAGQVFDRDYIGDLEAENARLRQANARHLGNIDRYAKGLCPGHAAEIERLRADRDEWMDKYDAIRAQRTTQLINVRMQCEADLRELTELREAVRDAIETASRYPDEAYAQLRRGSRLRQLIEEKP